MGFRGSRVQIPPSRLGFLAVGPTTLIVGLIVSARIVPGNDHRSSEVHPDLYVMETSHPSALVALWRDRAAHLDEYGDPNSARLWRIAAQELERSLATLNDESLSLVEAAAESGFTADHLGALVRRGVIKNAGRPKAPRIRRADLPHKRPGSPGRRPRRRVGRDHIRSIARSSLKEET